MTNRVEGQELASRQTVNPIETVNSADPRNRRRDNDDSKHHDKVRQQLERNHQQRIAVERLKNDPMQNPYNHHYKVAGTVGGYHPTAYEHLCNMPEGGPASTPRERLTNLEAHRFPMKHD
jgi:hypothetical protein